MDDDNCTTCGLRWYSWNKHPPCLKLSPEERKAIGATSYLSEPAEQPTDEH